MPFPLSPIARVGIDHKLTATLPRREVEARAAGEEYSVQEIDL